ncbi:phage protease [Pseudovibrio sp. POLY-S9]|uniref:phage protease n=1 Tax=Pseudovibrio sp. POLY-S9 TaxID=1576596 RepID=UPI0007093C95|nr:phage protease [Pseudovibrio sp. POLY-S9]
MSTPKKDIVSTEMNSTSIPLKQAMPLAEEAGWVHLIPSGRIIGRDGRTFALDDPDSVIREAARTGMELPIDYEHQTDNAPKNGKPAPAAGWIKELSSRDDGIWGRVEWTDKAQDMIANKEYRFLSPVLRHHKDTGRIIQLLRAGLTNRPNLHLTALCKEEDSNQNELGEAITSTLGLPEDTDNQTIISKVKRLLEAAEANFANGSKSGSVSPNATKSTDTTGQSLSEEQKVFLDQTANANVERCVNDGLLPPALKPWALALCKSDPKSFDEFKSTLSPSVLTFSTITPEMDQKLSQSANSLGDSVADQVAQELGIEVSALTQTS